MRDIKLNWFIAAVLKGVFWKHVSESNKNVKYVNIWFTKNRTNRKKLNFIKSKYLINNKKGLIPGKNQYNVTIINALNEEYNNNKYPDKQSKGFNFKTNL